MTWNSQRFSCINYYNIILNELLIFPLKLFSLPALSLRLFWLHVCSGIILSILHGHSLYVAGSFSFHLLPVPSQNCWVYVLKGQPTLVCPGFGVKKKNVKKSQFADHAYFSRKLRSFLDDLLDGRQLAIELSFFCWVLSQNRFRVECLFLFVCFC